MIRILIADDSPSVREALKLVFSMEADMVVIGEAGNGETAVELAKALKPDVITMDVSMPGIDGYAATRAIMESAPTPIVIVSANVNEDDAADAFRALEAGALAVIRKPRLDPRAPLAQFGGRLCPDGSAAELTRTVRLMSEVRVVRRSPRFKPPEPARSRSAAPSFPSVERRDVAAVAVGASTGGPPALRAMLAEIPPTIRFPLFVVQHIATGFLDSLTRWLAAETALPILVASHGEIALPGRVYFAPEESHMTVSERNVISLDRDPPEHATRPSVSHLFRSLARGHGRRAVAVILSGMGRDGAKEMLDLRELGALTIIQDQASSAIFGMPGEATRLGAACLTAPPDEIGRIVAGLGANLGADLASDAGATRFPSHPEKPRS